MQVKLWVYWAGEARPIHPISPISPALPKEPKIIHQTREEQHEHQIQPQEENPLQRAGI